MTPRLVIVIAMVASLLVPLGPAAAKQRVVRGSFVATAIPVPDPTIYAPEGLCLGRDGLDRVARRFVAPFNGLLSARISSAQGGWLLKIEDPALTEISRYNRLAADTYVVQDLPLAKGRVVDIVACNAGGLPEARVDYEFRATMLHQHPTSRRVQHIESGSYVGPTPTIVSPFRYDAGCAMACVEVELRPTDRYITHVHVADGSGRDVAFLVYQGMPDRGAYEERPFCTESYETIELIPDVQWVGVAPVLGSCSDGRPAAATAGVVTVTLSSHP